MANRGRGWHGDPEGHAEAARQRDKFNWWPLLFIPLAFFVGMGVNEATNTDRNQAGTAIQRGVGGGGGTVCPTISPTMSK